MGHGVGHHIDISIHALREEGDRYATIRVISPAYFYPRPPRGGRPDERKQCSERKEISIHALREEGDAASPEVIERFSQFLSTPSVRRATPVNGFAMQEFYEISIHALREEGDILVALWMMRTVYFYPLPP